MIRNRPTGRGSTPPHSFEFDRTLSPSDPLPSVVPRESSPGGGIVAGGQETDNALREKATVRDVATFGDVPVAAVTPSAASEYVPPREAPSASPHKTIETELVQLDPEVHPRTAQTVMDARRRARTRVDPEQVPTQPMPIQVRRATRRRVVRVVAAVLCLGAGAAFALVWQGPSWGRDAASENPQLQSSRTLEVDQSTTVTPRETPTLAIDVLSDLEQIEQAHSQPQQASKSSKATQSKPEAGARHAAHLTSPWSAEPEATEPSSEPKEAEKRAVWLE